MARKNRMEFCFAIRMRMFPNRKQEKILWKNLNASRFVYNQLLANSYTDSAIIRNKLDKHYPIPQDYWKYRKVKDKPVVIAKSKKRPIGLDRITVNRYPWLGDKDLDSMMFFNTEINYQSAWNMFRKVHKSGVPKFKRKNRPVQSYSTSAIKQKDATIYAKSSVKNLQGKNMIKNHALAMSISDTGWRTFLTQMEYKAKLYGKTFVEIDPKYTTQRCHACGNIKKGRDRIGLSGNKAHRTDHFTYICYNKDCPLYMQKQDRDVNASRNILDKGYKALLDFASPKAKISR